MKKMLLSFIAILMVFVIAFSGCAKNVNQEDSATTSILHSTSNNQVQDVSSLIVGSDNTDSQDVTVSEDNTSTSSKFNIMDIISSNTSQTSSKQDTNSESDVIDLSKRPALPPEENIVYKWSGNLVSGNLCYDSSLVNHSATGKTISISFNYHVVSGSFYVFNVANFRTKYGKIEGGTGTFSYSGKADNNIVAFGLEPASSGQSEIYVWNAKVNIGLGESEWILTSNMGELTVTDLTEREIEKPYTKNAAILNEGQKSKYDAQAEALRQKIVNSKNASVKGVKTYYVSYKGSDSNSGTSKDSPWRTINSVNKISSNEQGITVVLFERGGVYRGNLKLISNAYYGAYGEGYKPCLYGSAMNYAYRDLWKNEGNNIWSIETPKENGDIGNVVFNHGEKSAAKKKTMDLVVKEYDMYYNPENDRVYIKFSKGNPALTFYDIELCDEDHVVSGSNKSNITIENLCVKYGGAHGMSLANTKGVTIKNCEVGYIGGVLQNEITRYGNGIEFWHEVSDAVIDNCWVYQCYDAGITHQSAGGTGIVQKNIVFSNNLVEYCLYNIEYFIDQQLDKFENITYENNILRFAGYGWYDPTDRIGSNDSAVALICGWGTHGRGYNTTNFVIKNNIFDTSYRYILNMKFYNTDRNAHLANNTYLQKKSENASIAVSEKGVLITAIRDVQFKNTVLSFIEPKAKKVEFVEE